jgi:elongation factor Ts
VKIAAKDVKELRERTGSGIMDCKLALAEAKGNFDKAVEVLRKRGSAEALRKVGRATREGLIGSYLHFGGKIGVLVELNCETDFVANTPDFHELGKDLAMQVASARPLYVSREAVPNEVLEKEREIYREQALGEGKPEKIVDRIIEGKLKKFYSETCLLEQPFVKEDDISVDERVHRTKAKLGENILVRRFVRFQVGESLED